DAQLERIRRQLGRADALQHAVAHQIRDDDVASRRAENVAVRAARVEHDAARVATRAGRIGGIDREDARDRALRERPGTGRGVDRWPPGGVEVHPDDEVAALADDPALAGGVRAIDVHWHLREQAGRGV